MYTAALILHNLLRWSALIAGVGATFMVLISQGDNPRLERWGRALMVALDMQMLVGLALYFGLSPFTREAMADFGAAMSNPGLRFFAVEHAVTMVGAVALAHVGRVLARKARTAAAKRTRMLVCFGLSTLLMIVGTPWPGTPNGRPLFRIS
jgi:hypothetical protein